MLLFFICLSAVLEQDTSKTEYGFAVVRSINLVTNVFFSMRASVTAFARSITIFRNLQQILAEFDSIFRTVFSNLLALQRFSIIE